MADFYLSTLVLDLNIPIVFESSNHHFMLYSIISSIINNNGLSSQVIARLEVIASVSSQMTVGREKRSSMPSQWSSYPLYP